MTNLTVNVDPNQKSTTHLAKGDTVQFQTTADCKLHFTNPVVFNLMYVDLTALKPQTLTVQNDGSTSWAALSRASKRPAGAGNPNEIVVP